MQWIDVPIRNNDGEMESRPVVFKNMFMSTVHGLRGVICIYIYKVKQARTYRMLSRHSVFKHFSALLHYIYIYIHCFMFGFCIWHMDYLMVKILGVK